MQSGGLILELCKQCQTPLEPGDEACEVCLHPVNEPTGDWDEDQTCLCDGCASTITWGTPFCPSCQSIFDEEYWATRYEQYLDFHGPEELQTRSLLSLDIEDEIETQHELMLCCDAEENECECQDPVPADLVYELPPYVYEAQTMCNSCAYVMSPACPGLRLAGLKFHVNGGMLPEDEPPIQPCDKYQSLDHILESENVT